ncbi:glycosyltransferase family 2 protein [Escherichia coli]
MSTDKYLVSVITPTYNSERTIRCTIDSVLSQSYNNIEMIIVDDCSSDNTVSICREYQKKDSRVVLISNEKNYGAGMSRNIAISKAKGRFIAFLDSDDFWHKEKIKKQIDFMLSNNYAFTYTSYQKVSFSGKLLSQINPVSKVNYSELLKTNVIGCLTAVYDTSSLGKMFMPTIRKRQDMALWLSILDKIDYAYCLNETLAYYRVGTDTLSSNKLKIIFSQWAFYRKYLKFGLFKSLYYFSHYAVNAVAKHHINPLCLFFKRHFAS